jgi:hypothetical protein
MRDKKLGSALRAEHQRLRRQTEQLNFEHQRLRDRGATRAERKAHRMRLRHKRLELEEHYTRLRQLADERHRERQQTLADESHTPPPE